MKYEWPSVKLSLIAACQRSWLHSHFYFTFVTLHIIEHWILAANPSRLPAPCRLETLSENLFTMWSTTVKNGKKKKGGSTFWGRTEDFMGKNIFRKPEKKAMIYVCVHLFVGLRRFIDLHSCNENLPKFWVRPRSDLTYGNPRQNWSNTNNRDKLRWKIENAKRDWCSAAYHDLHSMVCFRKNLYPSFSLFCASPRATLLNAHIPTNLQRHPKPKIDNQRSLAAGEPCNHSIDGDNYCISYCTLTVDNNLHMIGRIINRKGWWRRYRMTMVFRKTAYILTLLFSLYLFLSDFISYKTCSVFLLCSIRKTKLRCMSISSE